MRDTSPPPSRSGNSKLIIIFLIGGVVVLAAAGVVIFKKRASNEPPPPSPALAAAAVDVSAPLVASQPTRQPIVEEQDTATEDEGDASKSEKNGKRSGKVRREKVGSIDTKLVNTFMNARFGQVKACYERRLKKNSFLEGKLDLNIDVSSAGKVTRVSVNKDTVRDSEMLACVKRTIRGWKFPKPDGGRVIIGKTFNFKKKQ